VYIEKVEDGIYWGSTENLSGGISAYGNSLDELKENLKGSFADYKEVAEELNETWLDEVENLTEFEI